MTRNYFRRSKSKDADDDDDDAQIVIDFLSSGKREITFWAENIRGPSVNNNYMKYKTFTKKITKYLSKNKRSYSAFQLARNKISAEASLQYATQYWNLSNEGTVKINFHQFYEEFVIVEPYDNVPSYKNFKDKMEKYILWHFGTFSQTVSGIDSLLTALNVNGDDVAVEVVTTDNCITSNSTSYLIDEHSVLKKRVKQVYSLIRRATGSLGGNTVIGTGSYGEITMCNMQKILDFLIFNCELKKSSKCLDIGSGLGKPNFHFAQVSGVRLSIGVEVDPIRHKLSLVNLNKVLREQTSNSPGPIYFANEDVLSFHTFEPFTHIYMFDPVFTPQLEYAIAKIFNRSITAKYLICYRSQQDIIEFGYHVDFMGQLSTKMAGSSQGHTVRFYCRSKSKIPIRSESDSIRIMLPPRAAGEAEEEVFADPCFAEAIQMAVSPVTTLRSHLDIILASQTSTKRKRKEISYKH